MRLLLFPHFILDVLFCFEIGIVNLELLLIEHDYGVIFGAIFWLVGNVLIKIGSIIIN